MGGSVHLFKVDELGSSVEELNHGGDWVLVNVVHELTCIRGLGS